MRAFTVCFSLLMLIAMARAVTAAGTSRYDRCYQINTVVFGEDGRHGLTLDNQILQEEIAYLDRVITHHQLRAAEHLQSIQLWQRQHPGEKIVDYDLQTDNELLTKLRNVRQDILAKSKPLTLAIIEQRNRLWESRCPERVAQEPEPKAPYVLTNDDGDARGLPLPGESPESFRCRDFNVELYGTDGKHGQALKKRLTQANIAAVTRIIDFARFVRSLQSESAQEFNQKTGRFSVDLEEQLKERDATLQQTRSDQIKYNRELLVVTNAIDGVQRMRAVVRCQGVAFVRQTPEPIRKPVKRAFPAQAQALSAATGGGANAGASSNALPAEIKVAETSRYGTFPNTWKLADDRKSYIGSDTRGVRATIAVLRFDATGATFSREDTAGPSTGLTARYAGTRNGNSLQGTVDFSFSDGHGTFTATW